MGLRTISIRRRIAMVAAVPTLALLFAVIVNGRQQVRTTELAELELQRIELLEALSELQTSNVYPELADVANQIRDEDGPVRILVEGFAQSADVRWLAAVRNLDQIDDRDGLLSEPILDSLMAQQALVGELRDDLANGRVIDAARIDEARRTRNEADLAFTDLSQLSTSDAWIIYAGKIDTVRDSTIEFLYLGPSLLGVAVIDSDQMASLSGRRVQATERVVIALPTDIRDQVFNVLGSSSYERWMLATTSAPPILRGEAPPWRFMSVSAVVVDSLSLFTGIENIVDESVSGIQAEVTARADAARDSQTRLLVFAVALVLVTTALTGVIMSSIVSPVRQLTSTAGAIAQGRLDAEPDTVGGSDELTELAGVLTDMALGLRHLDDQVRAIAEGRLDDPSLDAPAPGPVGAYVQQRVDDLRKASDALQTDAGTDELTGLLNRRGLIARIREDKRQRRYRTLLYIDLDRFKAVNDRFGHRHGDAVLIAVAERLSSLVRPDDAVVRLGGDEFLVVAEDVDETIIGGLPARIVAEIGRPIEFEGSAHTIGCSVGVATVHADATDPIDGFEEALDRADRRMLAAKPERQTSRIS